METPKGAFIIKCNKCNNTGELYQVKTKNPFSALVKIQGEFKIEYGDQDGYDHIKLTCTKCNNKVED